MNKNRRALLKAVALSPIAIPAIAMGIEKPKSIPINPKSLIVVTWDFHMSEAFKKQMKQRFEQAGRMNLLTREEVNDLYYVDEGSKVKYDLKVPVWVNEENKLIVAKLTDKIKVCYGEMICKITQRFYRTYHLPKVVHSKDGKSWDGKSWETPDYQHPYERASLDICLTITDETIAETVCCRAAYHGNIYYNEFIDSKTKNVMLDKSLIDQLREKGKERSLYEW